MSLSRRKFIQLSSLASASLMVPDFLKAFAAAPQQSAGTRGKVLLVIQLSGGNDGLNTVIPVGNDLYYSGRPGIGIKKEEALLLRDDAGLHPSLAGLKGLYDAGSLTILNSVGYPEPNRSHFRSMDIWQTASGANDIITSGWIGRYLDQTCPGCPKPDTLAIEVDDSLSLSMKGKDHKALAIRDIDQFYKASKDPYLASIGAAHAQEHDAQLASYLYKTLRETVTSADYVYTHSKTYTTTQTYPDTPLGKRMKTIGSLIASGSDTKVYYLSHGSFDTHVGQRNQQDKLLKQLDEALTAFTADMKAAGRFEDVLVMTFSEFGRRVAQNASGGTDHGTAGNMFLIGGGLKKPGLYNEMPDLADLDQGDLKYKIDFRQVYATVLDHWLDTRPQTVLDGHYEPLLFV